MIPTLLPLAASLAVLATGAVLPAQSWTRLTLSPSPSPRAELCGTYDLTRGQVVVYGGRDRGGVGFDETWLVDGAGWTLAQPAASPTGRMRGRMAFDAARGVAVLFGGTLDVSGTTRLDDTWEWDGSTWMQVATPNRPTPRHSVGLAYDLGRNVTVMFGGLGGTPAAFDETWEYDGVDWTLRQPATVPPRREGPAMAFDPLRGLTVMFGGYSSATSSYLDDTWIWDGNDWTELLTTHAPGGRKAPDLAYDFVTGMMVTHGGFRSGSLADTWQFDGYDWVEIGSVAGPTLSDHVLVHDVNRGVTVCFGGTNSSGFLADTWEYRSAVVASYGAFGAGCPGSGGTPTLTPAPGSLPSLGATLRVDVFDLPPNAATTALAFGFARLAAPVELGILGMPGCVLEVPLGLTVPVAVNRGAAVWQLGMPTAAAFVGTEFFNQAVTIDATANGLGVTLSNAGRGLIGI